MGRKNKRIVEDLVLTPIQDEYRKPKCTSFPDRALFFTGYAAQTAIDDARAYSRNAHERVYECRLTEGGCGYYHIVSEETLN